jgi:hypothetical protein
MVSMAYDATGCDPGCDAIGMGTGCDRDGDRMSVGRDAIILRIPGIP